MGYFGSLPHSLKYSTAMLSEQGPLRAGLGLTRVSLQAKIRDFELEARERTICWYAQLCRLRRVKNTIGGKFLREAEAGRVEAIGDVLEGALLDRMVTVGSMHISPEVAPD